MNIAVITSSFLPVPPVLGGAVEALTGFYLEENEKSCEHEFTVYGTYNKEAEQEASGFSHSKFRFIHTKSLCYRLKKKLFQKTHKCLVYDHHTEYFIHEVIRDLRRQHFDVVIVENKPGFVLPLSEATDARIVLHLHNDHLNSSTPYARQMIDSCHRVLTVSDYIRKRVGTIYEDKKIVTVHNGIDLRAFKEAKAIGRHALGISDDDFVLVFSGRLNKEKGIKELLEAMAVLKDEPSIKLLVLGGSFFGNETGDNDFIRHMKEIASPLRDRIVFTGFIPYKDIPSYLRIADVAVIPSIWDDPFPTSVLEAMATGLPIIATRSGGIPEEVSEDCCFLIDRADIGHQLPKAILALFKDRDKAEYMGRKALERSAMYDRQRYAQHILSSLT